MLLHWRLCPHMVLSFPSPHSQSLIRQTAIDRTRSFDCNTGQLVALLSNRAVLLFFSLIPSRSHCFAQLGPPLITQYGNNKKKLFPQSFEDVCCMPSAMVKENFCVFLSVREPTVTVHLTGFFHTPKLLQPQLRNPENCKQARQCLEFHTSLKLLILPFIATGFFWGFFLM